jgi:hypothetical protein
MTAILLESINIAFSGHYETPTPQTLHLDSSTQGIGFLFFANQRYHIESFQQLVLKLNYWHMLTILLPL